jgi:prepilin-type processing-associated H-X9-DG protein
VPKGHAETDADRSIREEAARILAAYWGRRFRINAVEPPPARLPRLHARHSGGANVLWLDGHVKLARPVYGSDFSGRLTEANLRANEIGDLAPGALTGDRLKDDFYFLLSK